MAENKIFAGARVRRIRNGFVVSDANRHPKREIQAAGAEAFAAAHKDMINVKSNPQSSRLRPFADGNRSPPFPSFRPPPSRPNQVTA